MTIILPGTFTGLNPYINSNRNNRYIGASIKKQETARAEYLIRSLNLNPLDVRPHRFIFTWYSKNKKVDPDNTSFAKKFILDGMVKAGFMRDDGWSVILGFEDHFRVDLDKPRVEIEIL